MKSLSWRLSPVGVFALLLLTAASPVWADVQNISVGVNGVTCPVCTHVLNMGLRRLPGVKSVRVSLATRVVLEITPHSGAWIEPEQIFQQIRLVGYTARPNDVKLRLRGTVTAANSQLLLTMNDLHAGPVSLILLPPESHGKQSDTLKAAIESLRNALTESRASQVIEVEGQWRPKAANLLLPTLLVSQLQPLSEKAAP